MTQCLLTCFGTCERGIDTLSPWACERVSVWTCTVGGMEEEAYRSLEGWRWRLRTRGEWWARQRARARARGTRRLTTPQPPDARTHSACTDRCPAHVGGPSRPVAGRLGGPQATPVARISLQTHKYVSLSPLEHTRNKKQSNCQSGFEWQKIVIHFLKVLLYYH